MKPSEHETTVFDNRQLDHFRVANDLVDNGDMKAMGAKAFCVWMVFLRFYDNNLSAPDISAIQEITGFSRAKVEKAILKLGKLGYVIIHQ